MKLTSRQIMHAEPGKLQDGKGLFLVKRTKANGKWLFRFSFDGKRPEMGLGTWPEISLAEARSRASSARELIGAGKNPIRERNASRIARRAVPTFAEVVELAFESRKAGLRDAGKAGRWLSPLELHVIPKIGNLLVTDIDQNILYETLKPIWRTKYPTAEKALGRINVALEYAVAQGHDVNLSIVTSARLLLGVSGHKVQHHLAMPWQEVPSFYRTLGTSSTVRRLLSFMILTGGAARTTPVRYARFDQITGNEWLIPADLMKGREGKTQAFRVPLSEAALQVVQACKDTTGGNWIFPGTRGKPITDVMSSKFMRDRGEIYKPHGFRTSFREWMAHIDVPFEVAETAIAHQVGTKVTRAYLRDDYWEKRVVIMDKWAQHLLTYDLPNSENTGP